VAAPTAPSGLTLTVVSTTSLLLTWTDNSRDESGFRIYRSTDGTTYTKIKRVGIHLGIGTVTWTDTGLTLGTLYYYKVGAYNADGENKTAAASATTGTVVVLAAPTSLTVVPLQGTKNEVNFTNASIGEDYHCIERKTGSGSYSEIVQLATGTTHYLDEGLTAGTTYTYKVRDLSGTATYGAYSSEVAATMPKPFTYIAYGTGATAEAVGLTTLTTETARALAEVTIESTYTANDTVRFSHEFAAAGSITVTEVGIFDASAAGTMLARKLLSPTLAVTESQYFLVKYDLVAKDDTDGCGG
jgi:hypothetical protein